MNSTRTRRRIVVAASAVFVFAMAATACGEDVVNDDVEKEINEIDNSIADFVDTLFTDDTGTVTSTTTGG